MFISSPQGYVVGNPATGDMIDESSKVPFAHGFGIISDQLYEVTELTWIHYSRPSLQLFEREVLQIIHLFFIHTDDIGALSRTRLHESYKRVVCSISGYFQCCKYTPR
jgi:hypothetical protein